MPGDGIGAEVTVAATRVLLALRPDVDYVHGEVGVKPLEREGSAYPLATRELCRRSDAILFGAVGDPRYDAAPAGKRPEFAILELRRDFDLFANLRPVKTIPGLEHASSLKAELVENIDLVVVRETTSGLYFGKPKEDAPHRRRRDRDRHARLPGHRNRTHRARRLRIGPQTPAARDLDRQGQRPQSGRLWRKVVNEVHAAEYADVALSHLLVDNAAMQLVRDPRASTSC